MAKEIPLLYGSPKDKTLFTAKDRLKYVKSTKRKVLKIPRNCILCFSELAMRFIKRKYETKFLGKWSNSDIFKFKAGKKTIGLINLKMFGASPTGAYLEEFIEKGVKNLVILGSAGSLQDNLEVGSLVIVTKAIRDEGTSYHYLKPSKYVNASRKIISSLKKASEKIDVAIGSTWTTDAPYRETLRKIRKYRKEGTLTVDMEAASVFAVAKYRKINAGAIFWISDVLSQKWKPGFYTKEYKEGLKKAATMAVEALKLLS